MFDHPPSSRRQPSGPPKEEDLQSEAAKTIEAAASNKIADYIKKTEKIITSQTIYKSALERNIDAFYQAVETEEEMQGIKAEMTKLREEYTRMREENAQQMEEMKQLILSLTGEKREKAASA